MIWAFPREVEDGGFFEVDCKDQVAEYINEKEKKASVLRATWIHWAEWREIRKARTEGFDSKKEEVTKYLRDELNGGVSRKRRVFYNQSGVKRNPPVKLHAEVSYFGGYCPHEDFTIDHDIKQDENVFELCRQINERLVKGGVQPKTANTFYYISDAESSAKFTLDPNDITRCESEQFVMRRDCIERNGKWKCIKREHPVKVVHDTRTGHLVTDITLEVSLH